MMRATTNVVATVELMVAAIPEMRLRELFVRLILDSLPPPTPPPPPPAQDAARPRRGRPPKAAAASNGRRRRTTQRGSTKKVIDPKLQERRRRYEVKRRTRRAAKTTAAVADAGSNGKSQDPPPVTSQALWAHATRLEPASPWRAVARELGIHIDVARRAFHTTSVPYGVRPMMMERFLTVRNTT
jgi:hypothetical protein